ncbi:BsuPI-related putative proteinase inhibitor [Sutcliffiella horikoshii]|uniref:BsuPI-related putative proteinase inhibitor n=1 Tax=Sutcliffiella horikoshii TaxID=79883 RepID=UPI003CF1A009
MYKMMILLVVFTMLAACGTGGNSNEGITKTNDTSSGSEVTDDGGNDSDLPDDSDDTEESKEELKKDLELEGAKEGELSGQIDRQNNDFLFIVTNTKDQDVDIHFSSGKEYDYVVQDETGKTVKRLSTGMMYTQAIKELVLAPGESLEYPTTYKDVTADLPPGEYTIQFIFTDSNHHATAKETFTVE